MDKQTIKFETSNILQMAGEVSTRLITLSERGELPNVPDAFEMTCKLKMALKSAQMLLDGIDD